MKLLILALVITLSGCSIGKGGLTTGLDGCVSVHVNKGTLSVPSLFNVQGEGLNYHKVNETCKDVPYHGKAAE